MARFEVAVIGGGVIGAALAYGLARQGLKTVMLDEGDSAFRAARGNFGLIWVQGKGVDAPAYADWTRASADLWPEFAAELETETGVALGYARPPRSFLPPPNGSDKNHHNRGSGPLARQYRQVLTSRRFWPMISDSRLIPQHGPDLSCRRSTGARR